MKLLPTILLDCSLILIGIIPLVFLLAALIRCRRRVAVLPVAASLAAIAFLGLIIVQPALRADYSPGRDNPTTNLTLTHGAYPPESDAAGDRFVWTQDHITFLIDALVHGPITITFQMRSAAVAGGPDAPVEVEIDGVAAGQLRPDPANPTFQPITLRLTPYDWGGHQMEIKLVPKTFRPGKGDSRVLGTMLKSVSVDMRAAWPSAGVRRLLIGMLAICAAVAVAGAWIGRRRGLALGRYAAFGACIVGGSCALAITLLVMRAGVVTPRVYEVWIIASAYLGALFLVAATLIPLGPGEARSLARRGLTWSMARPMIGRPYARVVALGRFIHEESPAGATRRAILWDLRVVFIVALGIRLIWAVLVPPWMGIDETEHFAYTNHIVEQHRLPGVPVVPQYGGYSVELTSSLSNTLFYPAIVADLDLLGLAARPLPASYDFATARSYTATGEDRFDSGIARAAPYPPLYYLITALPDALFHDQSIVSRLFAMRAITALIGALSCVFAYLFAYELRRTRLWGWSLGLCIAFMPTYAHLTASVNNDAAVDASAIVLIWLIVRFYRRAVLSAPIAFALGALSGLSLLSKPNAVPILAVAGVIVLIRAFPLHRHAPHISSDRLRVIALYVAGGTLTYGPWLLFRLSHYGDIGVGTGTVVHLARVLQAPFSATHVSASGMAVLPIAPTPFGVLRYSLGAYLHFLHSLGGQYFDLLLIKGFWGIFGWGGALLPDKALTAIKVFYAVGIIGLIAQFIARRSQRRAFLALVGVVLLQIAFIFVGVDYYQSFARTGAPLGIQGRYFMPMLAPLLYLLLSGWDHLAGSHPIALRIAPIAMLLLDIAAFADVLTVHYGITG